MTLSNHLFNKEIDFVYANRAFAYHPQDKEIVFVNTDNNIELYNYENNSSEFILCDEPIIDFTISKQGDKLLVSKEKQSSLFDWKKL